MNRSRRIWFAEVGRDPLDWEPVQSWLGDKPGWNLDRLREWLYRSRTRMFRPLPEDWLTHVSPPLSYLFCQGNGALLGEPAIACVGTRSASLEGRTAATKFARSLAQAGLHVVSGLARGIDTAAHRGAILSGGPGRTWAVLGSGLERVYPRDGHRLIAEILDEGGCVLSEHLPDETPRPYYFPLRNRLVAGLADLVFVVEAPEQSGALITARWALELGKEVAALAGGHLNRAYFGNHFLIQQGAQLIFRPEDLLETLPVTLRKPVEACPSLCDRLAENRVYTLDELNLLYPGHISDLSTEIQALLQQRRLYEIESQHYIRLV